MHRLERLTLPFLFDFHYGLFSRSLVGGFNPIEEYARQIRYFSLRRSRLNLKKYVRFHHLVAYPSSHNHENQWKKSP